VTASSKANDTEGIRLDCGRLTVVSPVTGCHGGLEESFPSIDLTAETEAPKLGSLSDGLDPNALDLPSTNQAGPTARLEILVNFRV
jgi:hypothetical protein